MLMTGRGPIEPRRRVMHVRIRFAPMTAAGTLVVLLALAGVWPPAGAQAETLFPAQRPGYWVASSDGAVLGFGDAPSARTAPGAATSLVGVAANPGGAGYWTVASDGGVFAFGDAGFFGSAGNLRLAEPIVGMASAPTGRGYWIVASDGVIFSFGDTRFFGSTDCLRLA
jgi:hypothetical protein